MVAQRQRRAEVGEWVGALLLWLLLGLVESREGVGAGRLPDDREGVSRLLLTAECIGLGEGIRSTGLERHLGLCLLRLLWLLLLQSERRSRSLR